METNTQLEKIVTDSGLQLSEAELIKQSYLPYFEQLAEIKELAKKINFENPAELDEKIARDLRLRTVKIRTGSETVKDERKRIHTLKANVEQTAWNLIKSTCQLDEETFLQVEKKREIAEKARIELLRVEREKQLLEYTENVSMYPLGVISEEAFKDLINGFSLAKKEKERIAKEEIEKQIAKEKAEAEEREKIRLENERLKADAVEKDRLAEIERKKQAEILEIEKAKAEAIRLTEQKKADELLEAQRKKAEAEKAKADAELKAAQEKARIEAEKQAKILADQKAANDKLQAEIKAKADAELKEKERKENEAKAALKAPDKTQLLTLLEWMKTVPKFNLQSKEGQDVLAKFKGEFNELYKSTQTQISNL